MAAGTFHGHSDCMRRRMLGSRKIRAEKSRHVPLRNRARVSFSVGKKKILILELRLLIDLFCKQARRFNQKSTIENLKSIPPCRRRQRSAGRFYTGQTYLHVAFGPRLMRQPYRIADGEGFRT